MKVPSKEERSSKEEHSSAKEKLQVYVSQEELRFKQQTSKEAYTANVGY